MSYFARHRGLIILSLIMLSILTACGQAAASNGSSTHLTPTASPVIPDPYLPHQGTLALNDPLKNNNLGHNWDEEKEGCWFARDGYHDATAIQNYNFWCAAFATKFSNFVYETQMTILKGQGGGLFFRGDANNSKGDYFRVDQTGFFMFIVYTGHTSPSELAEGNIANFHKGVGHANLIAVVAQGNRITLYANHQAIKTVTDLTFSQGQIGVGSYNNDSPVDVAFTNARVWKL